MSNKEQVKAIIRERARKSRPQKQRFPEQWYKDADWLWAHYFCDKGIENTKMRDELVRKSGFSDRHVRDLIRVLRHTGRLVCNVMDGKGYYPPKYLDEALPYIFIRYGYKCSEESEFYAALNCLDALPVRPGMEDITGSGEVQQTAL